MCVQWDGLIAGRILLLELAMEKYRFVIIGSNPYVILMNFWIYVSILLFPYRVYMWQNMTAK